MLLGSDEWKQVVREEQERDRRSFEMMREEQTLMGIICGYLDVNGNPVERRRQEPEPLPPPEFHTVLYIMGAVGLGCLIVGVALAVAGW